MLSVINHEFGLPKNTGRSRRKCQINLRHELRKIKISPRSQRINPIHIVHILNTLWCNLQVSYLWHATQIQNRDKNQGLHSQLQKQMNKTIINEESNF